ncbi:DUF3837 domain-containing protein [Clostridium sp. MCC353]|uniref:DUF3837 family protein n=1 Tax=Clostridium sp. MCC353 TaxID=2592646 RepID=UPI001C035F5C|nr:DUF3837 family protein [Clostridium sp. MCC353]MBT9776306.1 DUF3837 domain-containing protein [Clostridium sp. MCC353]
MVFSINKQAVEIKTRFEHAQLTSKYEVVATIGMLSKIYGLPLPPKQDTLDEMRAGLHASIDHSPAPSDYAEKLISLLDYYDQNTEVTDEMYELLKYSYEDQV